MPQINIDSLGIKNKNIIDLIVPVGIIISLDKNTSPATLYPGTTWTRIKGRCIVGVDENNASFNTPNKTGGEQNHTLSINEMPTHTHAGSFSYDNTNISNASVLGTTGGGSFQALAAGGTAHHITPPNAGASWAHNNMQPYITAYMWKRTA